MIDLPPWVWIFETGCATVIVGLILGLFGIMFPIVLLVGLGVTLAGLAWALIDA